MTPSPAKRRKSNFSIPIPVAAREQDTASGARNSGSPTRSPTRAAYRAPTRASLSRFHPDLFARVVDRSADEKARRRASQGHEEDVSEDDGEGLPSKSDRLGTGRSLRQRPSKQVGKDTESLDPLTSLPTGRTIRRKKTTQTLGRHDEPKLPPTPTALTRYLHRNESPSKKPPQLPSPERPLRGRNGTGLFDSHDLPVDDLLSREIGDKALLRNELQAQLGKLQGEVAQLENQAARLRFEDPNLQDEQSLRELVKLISSSNPACAPEKETKPRPPPLSSMLTFLLPFSAPKYIPTPEPKPNDSMPENPHALKQPENALPYLQLFAPLSLNTNITTSIDTSRKPATHTQLHNIVLSPPTNFPRSIYEIPLRFQSDPEKSSVISIAWGTSDPENENRSGVPLELKSWVDARLSSPLGKHDISGLCWGICRYWEASILRAKLWVQIENLSTRLNDPSNYTNRKKKSNQNDNGDSFGTTDYSPSELVAHFHRTAYQFLAPKGSEQDFQLLVNCPISLDIWTSEPRLEPDICVLSSLPDSAAIKIEREGKRVFRNMLKRGSAEFDVDVNSFVKAVEAVLVILFGYI